MAIVLDGKACAEGIKNRVKARITDITTAGKRPPALAVVLAGQNPASLIYIKNKEKACAETGIQYTLHEIEERTPQAELLALIDKLNSDGTVDGILVQQPLPGHMCKNAALTRVDPLKDVDCLHPLNIGLYMTGQGTFLPCTPAGVVRLLKDNGVVLEGKHCVVVGRSDVAGKPLAMLMLRENATVTVCHSRTQNLADITRQADILVAAVGKPRFITADMISPGCAVADIGVNRLEGRKVCGDVDYSACLDKASYITPVPGGVGPMTIAMLTENCLAAYEQRIPRQHP
jgi:methylenetetrahydrofolate dehydrogenase (NADP+)/methenyltetrahydrofolate cyclohydrolase